MSEKRLDEFIREANKALEEGKLVRIVNDLTGTTTLYVDTEPVMSLTNTIVYPGFINCTKPGSPCRILRAQQGLGFEASFAKDWKQYSLVCTNEFNSYDWVIEDEDSYYGSDEYFEDGYEASYTF